jgi:hypothetical protein
MYSLKNCDLSDWHRGFELPLSMPDLYRFRKSIEEELFATCRENIGTEIGDALLIEIKLYFEYIRVFHFLFYKGWVERKGFKLLFDPRTKLFQELSNGNYLLESIDTRPKSWLNAVRRSPLVFGRHFLYGVRVNRSIMFPFNSWDEDGRRIINTNPCVLSSAYARRISRGYIPFFERDLVPYLSVGKLCGEEKEFDDFSDNFSRRLCAKAMEFGVELPEKIRLALSALTALRLKMAAKDLNATRNWFGSRKMKYKGFCGVQAGYFNRLVALSVKSAGGVASGFVHGYDYGRVRDYRAETSIVDNVVTYTKMGVADIRSSFSRFPSIQKTDPKVISADYADFKVLCGRRKVVSKNIRKIMIICHCYDSMMNLDKAYPDITYFHIEMTVIRILVAAGYEVLYKQHPESDPFLSAEMLSRAFPRGVSFVSGHLEEHEDEADAFVFYYTNTTTFARTLCSCKPIAMIVSDEYIRSFSSEAMDLLKKRCGVVDFAFDEGNVLRIDEAMLLSALKDVSKVRNSAFIEKYMIP